MKGTATQIISSLATISWGIVPVYFYATGLIGKYLSPAFFLIALIGGLAMIVLGTFNLIFAKRNVGCGHDHSHEHEAGDHEHDHDHDHHAQSPVAALCLMILPVIVCTGFTKHEYSKEALRWKGLYKQRSIRSLYSTQSAEFTRERLEQGPKSAEGNYLVQLSELYWSAGDEKIMKIYQDLPAELQGRIIEEEPELNHNGKRKRLYRMIMNCCAADAQVLGIALEFEGPLPDLSDKTWVKATGKVAFEKVDKQYFAYLKECTVETATAPDPRDRFRRR